MNKRFIDSIVERWENSYSAHYRGNLKWIHKKHVYKTNEKSEKCIFTHDFL